MLQLKPQTVRIPPDTGHHYLFAEIAKPIPAEIRDVCQTDRAPWEIHPEHAWIRYRFTVRLGAEDRYGILIAVESNTGDAKRGWHFNSVPVNNLPITSGMRDPSGFFAFAQSDQIDAGDAVKFIQIEAVHPVSRQPLVNQPLEVHFLANAGQDPIDVDLVVDFGNTRTIALLLESSTQPQALAHHCSPVRFMPRMLGYEDFKGAADTQDPLTIADSWIVLHETPFSDLLPPNTEIPLTKIPRLKEMSRTGIFGGGKTDTVIAAYDYYLPQMFVEYSPVILGGGVGADSARSIMGDPVLPVELDANYFLSSPKRYAWDRDPVGSDGTPFWHVQPNRWNPISYSQRITEIPKLKGPLLMLMDPRGSGAWSIENSPLEYDPVLRPHANQDPTHPRCETMTWSALAVLELAKRQLNSPAYRQRAGNQLIPRRIRKVIVTYPSGWTLQEYRTYQEQWQNAISIFTLSHYQNRSLVKFGGNQPELVLDLDEAVASQLPIIYSEIKNLGKAANRNNWLQLTGRVAGQTPTLRVMNIDIGGGTTDISVIEYRDSLQQTNVYLECQVLFKNSMTIAGDTLVKRIIERVLLPSITARVDSENPAVREAMQRLFDGSIELDGMGRRALRGKLARILRLVFVPIINHWLSAMVLGTSESDELLRTPLKDIRNSLNEPLVVDKLLDELNYLIMRALSEIAGYDYPNVVSREEPINCQTALIEKCIEEVFRPVFRTLSRIVAAFDCDLVLVSGKPSELPQMRTLLNRILPLLPQRIIFANDYPVGDWYPVGARGGKIKDAKSPTVVGAALYLAMSHGMISNWTIKKLPPQLTINRNAWGLIPSNPSDFEPFLTTLQVEQTIAIQLGARIGRKRFSTPWLEPEPVYEFRLKPGWSPGTPEGNLFNCTFKRAGTPESGEELLLTHVCTLDNETLDLAEFELRLNTLLGNEFWMDSPTFEIDYVSESV